MNFVIKSTQIAVGKRPVQRWKLSQLLIAFGVPQLLHPFHGGHRSMFPKWGKRSLWDVVDLVKERWKQLRRQLHPDVSGLGYEPFAVMSAIHDTIMRRLKQKGVA